MRVWSWIFVAALGLGPLAARADDVLDHPHQVLGEGVSLVVYGRYADAEKKIREALKEDPILREGHYNLAVIERNTGRLDDAIAEYTIAEHMYARDDEPNRAKCLYGIGLAKEARGDKDAWQQYIAFARPLKDEQSSVKIAIQHEDVLRGVMVPGGPQKAAR